MMNLVSSWIENLEPFPGHCLLGSTMLKRAATQPVDKTTGKWWPDRVSSFSSSPTSSLCSGRQGGGGHTGSRPSARLPHPQVDRESSPASRPIHLNYLPYDASLTSCWTYFYNCLLFSYTVFIVLLPITYWICVLKLKQTDRIVIFR